MADNDNTAQLLDNPPAPPIAWQRYLALCKPKVVLLIAFTALVGMLLAMPGIEALDTVFLALIGIGLAAASGAAINHLVDRRIDGVMNRTKDRPLPQGDINSVGALIFAVSLAVAAITILILGVNLLTAVLTFMALVDYAVIYTMYPWLSASTLRRLCPREACGFFL